MDYTISALNDVPMRRNPTTITVTLLNDRVTGEGVEDITLTLIQDSRTPSRSSFWCTTQFVSLSWFCPLYISAT